MSHFLINCIALQEGSLDGRGGGGGVRGGGECGGAGQWKAMDKGGEGQQVSNLLLKEMPLAVYEFKKASLINDSFISEVKSRWKWRPRRRGGHLSSPRKLHGKNISKCISKMVP